LPVIWDEFAMQGGYGVQHHFQQYFGYIVVVFEIHV
jgi:hypothetical protein